MSRPKERKQILVLLAALSLLWPCSAAVAQNLEEGKRSERPRARGGEPVVRLDRLRREPQTRRLWRQELSRGSAANHLRESKGMSNFGPLMRAAADLTGVGEGSSTSIADVNNDGNQDLLVTGDKDPSLNRGYMATLYLGNGNGSFTKSETSLTGVRQSSSSIADVNGDGNPDLLISGDPPSVEFDGLRTTLYLGDGKGGFTSAGSKLTGLFLGSTSIADVNRDENPDLLVTGADIYGDQQTHLYLGDGQGEFSEEGEGLPDVFVSATSIADINGDGNPDLLITGNTTGGFSTSGKLTALYLGNGQGEFTEAEADLTDVDYSSTSIADVNGDDNPDLLVTGQNKNLHPTATLYLGDGQAGFTEAEAGLTGVMFGSTSIGDIDGDGNLDLLIAGDKNGITSGGTSATLYLGDGQGEFTEAGAGLFGVREGSTSIADIDGDGDSDFVVTGNEKFRDFFSARLYINPVNQTPPNQAPRFAQMPDGRSLAPGLTFRRSIEAGDPDGDSLSLQSISTSPNVTFTDGGNGTASVTFTPSRNQGGDPASITVRATDSGGKSHLSSTSVEVSPVVAALPDELVDVESGSISIADVNGDDNPDILITGENENRNPTSTLYLGDGQGGFTEAGADLTDVVFSSTSIADVNNDGNPDLLIAGDDDPGAVLNASATLYLGDGEGGFTEVNAGLDGVWHGSTSIADVNEDGNPDLLITGQDANGPTATLYLGDGQGGFAKANADLTGVSDSSSLIADVNGDTHLDILIIGRSNSGLTATLYLGNGEGSYTKAGANLTGVSGGSTSIGDVDGDGNRDLLITGWFVDDELLQRPSATLYLGNGQGGFSEANAGLTAIRNGSGSIEDVNGDGNQDLLVTGNDINFNPTTTLYLGDGQGGFTEAESGFAGVRHSYTSFADIDGDEDPDLVTTGFSETSRSKVSIIYENLFNNPLPVQLSGLDAVADGNKVHLIWQTASETSNAIFEVQRKAGVQSKWRTVGSVEGAGTVTEPQSYRFTDENLPYKADQFTYRLRQVDMDGSASYSEEITVELRSREVELLSPYPNPAQDQATVRYAVPKKREATLRIYDVLGREVKTSVSGKREGRHERQIDVSDLSSGTYFFRLEAGNTVKTQRLTVVH